MRIKNVFLFHTFDFCHGAQNGVERAEAQWAVVGNRQPVVTRGIRLQNFVAALLVNPAVAVMFAKQLD